MCFVINKVHTSPKIAEEDIICYKVIGKNNISIHRDFNYMPNVTYPDVALIPRKYEDEYDTNFIEEGYHSYSSLDFACDRCYRIKEKVVLMIIPKGATYYYNPICDEYVSSVIRSGDLRNFNNVF